MITLDGSHGEGGGQIIRTALALSMLTQQAFQIINIRKGRQEPGLKAQHLAAIRAFQAMSDCTVSGAEIGSQELCFVPAPITRFTHDLDIGTAGSISLVLQALLLPCSFASKQVKLTLHGGTDVAWSMPVDYVREVLLPRITGFASIKIEQLKRGYYPTGGGLVHVTIKQRQKPKQVKPLELSQPGALFSIKGISHASEELQNAQVAERQANAARLALSQLGVSVEISTEYRKTASTGSGITLWAVLTQKDEEFSKLGADALGSRGMTAEKVGIAAAQKLLTALQSRAPVDQHLADNLLPWMALARPSSILAETITEHTRTNAMVIEQFLPVKFRIEGNMIVCE